jgi:hypothetical protein
MPVPIRAAAVAELESIIRDALEATDAGNSHLASPLRLQLPTGTIASDFVNMERARVERIQGCRRRACLQGSSFFKVTPCHTPGLAPVEHEAADMCLVKLVQRHATRLGRGDPARPR